jgi:hypothetical protein
MLHLLKTSAYFSTENPIGGVVVGERSPKTMNLVFVAFPLSTQQ